MTERRELVDRLALLSEEESTRTALFHQAAAASLGLGITDMRALSVLVREGAQTAGALMAHLHVTSGAVTGVIDRLERTGFARRTADPADRRRVVVEADPERLGAADNVYARMGAAFESLYARYSVEELEFLAGYLESAIAITRDQTERISAA
jgi:DNA-binding MarR family transcriptional regulator